jgi:hypothetical protein
MIPQVSGWIKLVVPVDLKSAHPDPKKWDIKRPHPTMMILVNREDGFKVMVTPNSVMGYFKPGENPLVQRYPSYVRDVAVEILGLKYKLFDFDPYTFTLWECQIYCELEKPLGRKLDKKDQATLAGVFTDYEIFERKDGRVKMVGDTHDIYITPSSLVLYPANDKFHARDITDFSTMAIKAAYKLQEIVFD